MKYKQIINEN
jgi:hypothetical protein